MTITDLAACCGSNVWAEKMFQRQPFANSTAMHEAAEEIWWSLTRADWLEAFSKHPKIGQQSSARWSAKEQGGMAKADLQMAAEMADLNAEYADKFGFVFIVCATGKTAEEMLQLLRVRIKNDGEEELRIAAGEQAMITHLRMDKLVSE